MPIGECCRAFSKTVAQMLPDDRKIESARSLTEAEDLLVGASVRAAASANEAETDANRLDRTHAVFQEMQQQYAKGNFTRFGELLQQLEKPDTKKKRAFEILLNRGAPIR
jgi:hypothetical protein